MNSLSLIEIKKNQSTVPRETTKRKLVKLFTDNIKQHQENLNNMNENLEKQKLLIKSF